MEIKEDLSTQVIGCAIEVHRELGSGLLESAYQRCLCYELNKIGIPFESEVPLPVRYKGIELDCAYRIDILVDNKLIIELKHVDRILGIHEAQLITYLKLANIKTGLLLNFNNKLMKDGIKRISV